MIEKKYLHQYDEIKVYIPREEGDIELFITVLVSKSFIITFSDFLALQLILNLIGWFSS